MIKLSDRLKGLGYNVYTTTEIATMLFSGGAKFSPNMTKEELIAFQQAIMKIQMTIEDSFIEIAKSTKKKSILFYDRGVLDGTAYMSKEDVNEMMNMNKWSIPHLRDSRYDAIIHLVTAAIGAEKYYGNENNKMRKETIEQARELDLKLRNAYIGHPNLYFVDNRTGFDEKIQRVVQIVSKVVGLPKPCNLRRRFLLNDTIDAIDIPVPFEELRNETIFLDTGKPEEQWRIRKRGQKSSYTYSISRRVKDVIKNEEMIKYRPISAKNYSMMKIQQSNKHHIVRKKLKSFVWKEHYYVLTSYVEPNCGLSFLTLEVDDPEVCKMDDFTKYGKELDLPDFLKKYIVKEVTGDDTYSTYQLSLKKDI